MNSTCRKVRIAYVLSTDVRGGIEEHVLSLLENIDRSRFEPYLICPPRLVELFGQDLARLDVPTLALQIRGIFDLKNRYLFWRFLRQHKIDIINTHMFLVSLTFTPLAILARVPVTLETAHMLEHWRLGKSWIKDKSFIVDGWCALMQDAILAVSHDCKRDLVRVKRIRPDKIVVVQNGRCLSMFDPERGRQLGTAIREQYGLGRNEFVFGVMARLELQKGHKYLLDAVALLAKHRTDFRVLLIGDGQRRDALQEQASKLGINDRIVFAGFQTDVVGHYGAMDTMVLPSLYEGLPLSVIEAMAMEKAVIGTEVEGTREIVQNMTNGLLVPAKNPQALATALEYALNHREQMHCMGQAARPWVAERFSIERQVAETESLYESLVSKAGLR